MRTILLSHEEVAKIAERMYEDSIRQKVESEENIGKMVIILLEEHELVVQFTEVCVEY